MNERDETAATASPCGRTDPHEAHHYWTGKARRICPGKTATTPTAVTAGQEREEQQ